MIRSYVEALDWLGAPYVLLDRDGCAEAMGTRHYTASVYTFDPFLSVGANARLRLAKWQAREEV